MDADLREHLRRNERRLLAEKEAAGDVDAVALLRKLAQVRLGLRRQYEELTGSEDVEWRRAYEVACNAIERLLGRVENLHTELHAAGEKLERTQHFAEEGVAFQVKAIERELRRVRDERDDAVESAKLAFARERVARRS